jgi:hypothetical protein
MHTTKSIAQRKTELARKNKENLEQKFRPERNAPRREPTVVIEPAPYPVEVIKEVPVVITRVVEVEKVVEVAVKVPVDRPVMVDRPVYVDVPYEVKVIEYVLDKVTAAKVSVVGLLIGAAGASGLWLLAS